MESAMESWWTIISIFADFCSTTIDWKFADSLEAVSQVKTADVSSLTGLIKLFFRMLPESLFTDALYKNLQKGIGSIY